MKKILSVVLSLCMLVSLCTGFTTMPIFGEEAELEPEVIEAEEFEDEEEEAELFASEADYYDYATYIESCEVGSVAQGSASNLFDSDNYTTIWHSTTDAAGVTEAALAKKTITVMFNEEKFTDGGIEVGGIGIWPRNNLGGAPRFIIVKGIYEDGEKILFSGDVGDYEKDGDNAANVRKNVYFAEGADATVKGLKIVVAHVADGSGGRNPGVGFTAFAGLDILKPSENYTDFAGKGVGAGEVPAFAPAFYSIEVSRQGERTANAVIEGAISNLTDYNLGTYMCYQNAIEKVDGALKEGCTATFTITSYVPFSFSGIRLYQRTSVVDGEYVPWSNGGGNQRFSGGYLEVSADGTNWARADLVTAENTLKQDLYVSFGETPYDMVNAKYIRLVIDRGSIHQANSEIRFLAPRGNDIIDMANLSSYKEEASAVAVISKIEALEDLDFEDDDAFETNKGLVEAAREAYDELSGVQKLALSGGYEEDGDTATNYVALLEEAEAKVAMGGTDYYKADKYIDLENSAYGSALASSYNISQLFDGVIESSAFNLYGWQSASGTDDAGRTITVMFNDDFIDGEKTVAGVRLYPRQNGTGTPGYFDVVGIYDDGNGGTKKLPLSRHHVTFTLNASGYDLDGKSIYFDDPLEDLVGIDLVFQGENPATNPSFVALMEIEILKPKAVELRPSAEITYPLTFADGDFSMPPVTVTIGSDAENAENPVQWPSKYLYDNLMGYTGASPGHFEYLYCVNTAANEKAWIEFDLGREITFSGLRVYNRRENATTVYASGMQGLTHGYLLLSSDGENWYSTDGFAAASKTALYQDVPTKFGKEAKNIKARYVKLVATKLYGGEAGNWTVSEIRLLDPIANEAALTPAQTAGLSDFYDPSVYIDMANTKVGSTTHDGETAEPVESNVKTWTPRLFDGVTLGNLYTNGWHGNHQTTATGQGLLDAKTVTIMFNEEIPVGGVRLYHRPDASHGSSPMDVRLIGIYKTADGTEERHIIDGRILYTKYDVQGSEGYDRQPKSIYLEEAEELVGIKVVTLATQNGGTKYTCIMEIEVLKPRDKEDWPSEELSHNFIGGDFNPLAKGDIDLPAKETLESALTLGSTNGTATASSLNKLIYAFDNAYGKISGQFVEIANAVAANKQGTADATTAWIEIDLGEEKTFSGVRVYGRISGDGTKLFENNGGHQNMTKGYIYVSEDGETWLKSDMFSGARINLSQDMMAVYGGTQYNLKARYLKVEATEIAENNPNYVQNVWAFSEIRLIDPIDDEDVVTKTAAQIANLPRITNEGNVQIDVSVPEDVIIDDITLTVDATEVTKVEVDEEELTLNTDYTLVDKKIVLSEEFALSLEKGSHEVVITFGTGEVLSASIDVIDFSQVEFKFTYRSGTSLTRAENITLNNVKGLTATKVTLLEDNTVEIPFTADEETITITRSNFRKAFDVYKEMGKDGGQIKVKVEFEGGVSMIYTINMTGHWFTKADFQEITLMSDASLKAYDDDEIDVTELDNFAVRADSVWNNAWKNHPMSSFFYPRAAEGVTGYNYHAETTEGKLHYIDVDFGETVTVGGLRYQARLESGNYTPDWKKVIIYGSTNFETWTKLYEGAANNGQRINEFGFSDNASVRYVRIYIEGVNAHVTANSLSFLKPTSRVTNELRFEAGATEIADDVVINYVTYPSGKTLSKIELEGEEISSEDYFIGEYGTVTIKKESLVGMNIGDYELKLYFNDIADPVTATLKVANSLMTEFKFSYLSGTSVRRTEEIVLNNVKGLNVTKVTLFEDETVEIPFTANTSNITITRTAFRQAFDVYAAMGLEEGAHKVVVTFEDDTTLTYTITISGDWVTAADLTGVLTVNATFDTDEINILDYENFAIRPDSVWNNAVSNHPAGAFFQEEISEEAAGQRYHASTDEGRNHYLDVDFGENVTVGGVRYIARIATNGTTGLPFLDPNWSQIVISGSTDFETWETLYEGSATSERINDLWFDGNTEVRYLRIYIGNTGYPTANAIRILKPSSRILGTLEFEKGAPELQEDVVVNYITYPSGKAISKVEFNGEEISNTRYLVEADKITIDQEYFLEFEVGTYPLKVYFAGGEVSETTLKVNDCTETEFKFSYYNGTSVARTEKLELKNIKGLSVTKVVLKSDGTVIPFTANEETITIGRSDFRKAFDVYKALGLETGKLQLLVKFEDNSYLTYSVILSGYWATKANALSTDATFASDEIDIITEYPDFAVRPDSVWNNAGANHPVNAFFRSTLAELTGGYRYHGETNEGNNHYLDIDFGATAEIGGLRYYARYEGGKYQPNWSKVEIFGSDDFETWEKLYDGKATGSARTTDLSFSKNAEVRYLRIYISNTQYATAASIRFLAPSLRIYNEFGGVMTSVTLEKANANEEVVVYTDLPVTGVKVGGATVSSSNYTFDAETMKLTIKKGALSAIKTAGVATTIEVFGGEMSAVLNVSFGEKLFSDEVLPYNFANTIKYVSGYSNGGGVGNLIDRGVVRRTADGKIMTNSDDDKKLKSSGFTVESAAAEIYSDSTTGAYPVIEIDYQIPHTFSGVRVYHRVWVSGGNRQFGQTMNKAYLQVSNDGVNWLTSDTWKATLDKGSNKNSYDDIKFMINGEEVNVTARYLRLCIVTTSNPTSIMEICLYKPGSGRSLNPAEITFEGERALFSETDPRDVSFGVVYNDAVALSAIRVVAEGEVITTVDPSYINTQGETIVITKDFFLDNGSSVLPEEFDFVMSFVMGDDVSVPAGYVEEEIHSVTFGSQDANVTVIAKRVDKETGEVIGEVSVSPFDAKRHEDTVFVATIIEDGYEAVWEIEENIQTTYEEKPLLFDDTWTLTTNGFRNSGRDYGIHRAFDNNNTTDVWSDTAGHGGSYDSVNNDLDITAIFGRRVTLSSMSWQHRIHLTSPNAYAAGQGVREYKLYAIVDSVIADTPFKTGTLLANETLQAITFDPIELDGLYIWMKRGNSNFSVADINLIERVATEKNVAVKGEVTRKGTKTEEFKIADLYADAVVKVSTVAVAPGEVKVTTDLVGLSTTADTPTTATKGETLEVTLVAHEGEELPNEITEITQDGHVLVCGLDFSYVKTTVPGEVSLMSLNPGDEIGVITIFNARGDIHIIADAEGVTRRKVTYVDEHGAKGTVPASKFYMEGDEITIASSSLKLTGYTFKGWNWTGEVVAEGEEYTLYSAGDPFVMPDEDVTFVAVWELKQSGGQPQRPQGGGGDSSDDDKPESFGGGGFGGVSDKFQVVISGVGTQAVTKGTVLSAPAVEAGYEFVGWYLDAAYTVPYANTGVTGSLTVYPYVRKVRQATDLADIQNHWAKEAISNMYVDYIVNGKSETAFDPDSDITRAEFCQILYKISGQTSDGSENFADVNVGDWFANAVAWAVNQGITMGTTEDTFSPYAKITREQMATMIYRYATKVGAEWEISGEASFADKAEISTYANYQVNWAADKGVISGYPDGTFGAKKEATRAEAVVMLTRLMNLLGR